MLTAYDAASSERYKWVLLDAAHLAATTDEFRRFTLELAKTPGRKIISNWEFENDCPPDRWAGCIAYYQARLDGILNGRAEAKALGYPGDIKTAFEFTIVPGFAGRPSGLVEAATKLKGIDYISYSAWWSIGWDASAIKMRTPSTISSNCCAPSSLERPDATPYHRGVRRVLGFASKRRADESAGGHVP